MVICLQRGADLHMAQLMPLPLTVSCFSKVQIGFTFLVPAYLGIPGKRAVKRACVFVRACVRACVCMYVCTCQPVLAGTSSQQWQISLVQSFAALMPLLMAPVHLD